MSEAAGWQDWVVRFGWHVGTGVVAVTIHYGVMAVALRLDSWPVAATSIGFLAGALARFHMSYYHVFDSKSGPATVAPRFVLALAAQFVVNALMVSGLIEVGVPIWWSQVVTTAILAVATYLAYRLLVFV